MKNINRIILGLISIIFVLFTNSVNAQGFGASNVKASLISDKDSVKAGSSLYIALKQEINPDWHTYWRNYGDVGEATSLKWTLPNGISAGDILWPVPEKLPFGEFVNYGYSNLVILPVLINIPKEIKNGDYLIKAKANWLECEKVCIPGEADLEIKIKISNENKNSLYAGIIEKTIKDLPKPLNINAIINNDNNLVIGLNDKSFSNIKSAEFFPYELSDGTLINHAASQKLETGENGASIKLEKSASFPKAFPNEIKGILKYKLDGQDLYGEINAKAGDLPSGLSGKSAFNINWLDFIKASLFAFFGGVILNLMPCVFPVLAMKIIGLTKIAHTGGKSAIEYGNFYGLGVIASFALLGAILFIIKALGASIGWGFQLQNPIFLTIISVIIFILALSLLGAFEIGTSLQGVGSNLANKNGNIGAFFSGVLAVMVASPCTAPFMGFALGFAVSSSPFMGMIIFIALGLGFALPFIILCYFPKLLEKLPKPGTWMVRLKQFLALPMFLTAAWLVWVLGAVKGGLGIITALSLMALVLISVIIHKQKPSKALFLSLLFVNIFAFGLGVLIINNSQNAEVKLSGNEKPWSEQAVSQSIASGKTVVVNFTADWCITCKVNERVAFNNPNAKKAFVNIDYYVADWTQRDEAITKALEKYGRAGVPLYLVYKNGNEKPEILPQLLTPEILINAIER